MPTLHRFLFGCLLTLLASFVSVHAATPADLLQRLNRQLVDKGTSLHTTLIPGVYGMYTRETEGISPRAYVDEQLQLLGNNRTGYSYLSGPKRDQDLSAEAALQLYRQWLAALQKEQLPRYVFGKGTRQLLLVSAIDCPVCLRLEGMLAKRAKVLDATIYIIPTSLHFDSDLKARAAVKQVLCAKDKTASWNALMMKRQSLPAEECDIDPVDVAKLPLAFPIPFPSTVPTLVDLNSGEIHPQVIANFERILGVKP